MRRAVRSSTISAIVLLGLFAAVPAFASTNVVDVTNNGEGSTTHVNVESNTGQNTICQNGKCTTTGSNGHATACVNGKCYDSDDGNLDVKSDNGITQVHIGSSPTIQEPTMTITPPPTPNIKPTIEEKKKEIKAKVDAKKKEIKDKIIKQH